MNAITQAKECRKALIRMSEAYTPYEGKNLNRFKSLPEISKLLVDLEENPPPFTIGGVFGNECIDHNLVNLERIKNKIDQLDQLLYSLDLFESSYLDEYTKVCTHIENLVKIRKDIENKVNGIPSYMFKDLLKD